MAKISTRQNITLVKDDATDTSAKKDKQGVKREKKVDSETAVVQPVMEPKAKQARKASTAKQTVDMSESPSHETVSGKTEFFSDYDRYLLSEGTHLRAYDKLGAHLMDGGVHFALWAPNARRVSVVGDFNAWDGGTHPMHPSSSGIWTVFVPGVREEALYKYELEDAQGHLLPLKADPFAFAAELPPATASKVVKLPQVKPFNRPAQSHRDPISIYEVHLGSWRRGGNDAILNYDELAATLIPYVKDMGFTHIELMPVAEHPFGGSWGYQPISMFAPTSRYGSPQQFADFVEAAHAAGLSVIIDWVSGHFPNDKHGLAQFDGSHLYEHQDPREGMHQDWGTLIYNYGRHEVANFLIANALFWMDCYGIDGLRVDAVASMIYRNYSRREGEWIPNRDGGVENFEATSLLKRMNEKVYANFPDAATFAEESTAWVGVSKPVEQGGLGFGFKWNMGWMHDTLEYMEKDPIHRRYHHDRMTFGMVYAYTENFVLPLSHDEVVYGKQSILGKMPGDEWQRFANLRAYYGFMYGHPGKKLLFMGGEFGQSSEWDHDQSLDWHLLQYGYHQGVQHAVRDLNRIYKETPALHTHDYDPAGFEWLKGEDAEHSVFAFLRRGDNPDDIAVIVSNFTPVPREGYRIGVPMGGMYKEVFNSDAAIYGGSNMGNGGQATAADVPHDGRPCSLQLTLPPLSTVIFQYRGNR